MSGISSISVVVPAYNAERYLAEAVDSVLNQAVPPGEVIVVDDGSTDATGDIARSFGPPVRVMTRPNGGIGAARNSALSEVTGDLLAFLDADDVWPIDRTGLLVERLESDGSLDGVFGAVVEFGEGIEDKPAVPAPLASSMLIRRASFERVGPFREDIRVGEFIDWYARADERGLRFAQIGAVVLRRRLHETNTGRLQRDARPDYVRVLRAALQRRRQAQSDG
mgnify:CR=1 FL=1